MEIKKATRKAIPFVGCFYGKSGSGKTYSAIKLSTGLVNGDKVCLIDTENGRASHYADDFDNLYILDLEPPFTPNRYIEAIRTAEKDGFRAIIIDSISHEWEGIGGCLEMAEEKTKSGKEKEGLVKWAKPKAEHRKFMNMLLQSKAHIIVCARAKEDLEQVKVDGKTEIVKKGMIPIQEKNFPFEMLVTFFMEKKGRAILEKATGVKVLENNFNDGEFVSEKHGKIIADWIGKGQEVDLEVKRLKEDARDVAMNEGEAALIKWFADLNDSDKEIAKRLPVEFKRDLMRIARDKDNSERSESKTALMSNPILDKVDKAFGATTEESSPVQNEEPSENYDQIFDNIKSQLSKLSNTKAIDSYLGHSVKVEMDLLKEKDIAAYTEIISISNRKKQELNDK